MWCELARQSYDDRRRREKIFKNESLFGEPAWDILLDLFIAAKMRGTQPVNATLSGE